MADNVMTVFHHTISIKLVLNLIEELCLVLRSIMIARVQGAGLVGASFVGGEVSCIRLGVLWSEIFEFLQEMLLGGCSTAVAFLSQSNRGN